MGKPPNSGDSPLPRQTLVDLQAQKEVVAELDEVERAMAILEGKDPEKVLALKRKRAEAEANFRDIAKRVNARKKRDKLREKKARKKLAIRAAIGAAVVIAAGLALKFGVARRIRWNAVDEQLNFVYAPYVTFQHFEVMRPAFATANRIELPVPGDMCFIAIGAAEGGGAVELKVEHGSETTQGGASMTWCSCADEKVSVTALAAPDLLVGVRLLGAAADIVGGTEALPFLDPPVRTTSVGGQECSATHLDGWIKEKRYAPPVVNEAWLDTPEARTNMKRAGLRVVSRAATGHPFAVVEPSAESCFLALASNADVALSLRLAGGERPIARAKGPIAWCSEAADPYTVWREGAGELTVLAGSSHRIGGLLGMREVARRGLVGELTVWVRPESLGRDAADTLRASGISEPVVFAPERSGPSRSPTETRVVAFSILPGGSFAPDGHAGVTSACSPQLNTMASESVCMQSWAQLWRQVGAAGRGGGAEGPLPYWLSIDNAVDDPAGLAIELGVLALARRLTSEGFAPTVLEGVTEIPKGVEVSGRVGEDAIVALGLVPRPPWVFPYTDGPRWTIDGDPRVVPLEPGSKLVLTTIPPPTAKPQERRTVVFRRKATKG